VVSKHSLGSACESKPKMIRILKRMSFISSYFISINNLPKEDKQKEEEEPCTSYSHQEEDKEISRIKTPSFEEKKGDKLTKLLPKSVHMIHKEFEEFWREMCKESPRGFEFESNSIFSYGECEHAATPYIDAQRSHMPIFSMREREEEGMPKRGTLSGFLHEYESQTQNFRDHISFL